jgi:hypothetical protein
LAQSPANSGGGGCEVVGEVFDLAALGVVLERSDGSSNGVGAGSGVGGSRGLDSDQQAAKRFVAGCDEVRKERDRLIERSMQRIEESQVKDKKKKILEK